MPPHWEGVVSALKGLQHAAKMSCPESREVQQMPVQHPACGTEQPSTLRAAAQVDRKQDLQKRIWRS